MSSGSWRLPGYAEIQELGAGAQGRVVLARHEVSGAVVAVKYLSAAFLGDTRARETFRNEAELLKRVSSPHVTRLIDYLDLPQGAAIVMEAVPGHSLRKVLDEHEQALMPETALSILKGSLQGLAAAHSVGVVHRDYKPANVLVQDDGQSKLLDFGVAGLTGQGGVVGTPAYMAPEQWHGAPATPATDVYAATCVFYECVTGHKPYGATTQQGLRAQHTTAPIPLGDLPEALRPLVVQGMAKDPGRRQWNVAAFVEALENVAVEHYGPDWERRGLVALGSVAAIVGGAVPLAVFGSGALSPGAVIGTGVQVAGEAGRSLGGKGLIAKFGGAKGAASAGAATAAATVAVFLWPDGPGVGGTSSAEYRAYFTRPSIVLANRTIPDGDSNASPLIGITQTVAPARVKAGTKVRLAIKWHARTPWGLQYVSAQRFQCRGPNSERADDLHRGYSLDLGDGIQGKSPKVWLFPVEGAQNSELPTSAPIAVKATHWSDKAAKSYDYSKCAWVFDQDKVSEFTVPAANVVRPGKYQLSPYHPIGIAEVKATINGRISSIAPASAGARVEGTLPTLEVLAS
ncbi:serine/threonine-protein kinase [Spirillospora sp. NPDC029432]|uniref:serine/threonine-protein kinase n=1 Tax=Spirillospora sp. NPDC029432 TaxID=3154599 RepID=UPI003456F2D4